MQNVPQIAGVYVTTASQVVSGTDGTGPTRLTFTAVAVPSPAAQSHRLSQYVKAAK